LIVETICGIVALYSALRITAEKNTLRKLSYLNVLNFAITGLIALILPHPLGLAAAAAYFVGATLESNALASTYSKRGDA